MEKLNNHIKSDKAKWIVVTIALIVMCALLAGCIAAIVTGTKPQDWGKKETGDETANIQIATMEQNQMLLSVATTAADNGETQKTVTATVTPADAYNKEVVWTIEWKSGNSWATGKNISDYITIATSGNGVTSPNTAVVTCKQAFGCQAILKATSSVQPDVYATCTIDYTKRVTNVNVKNALRDQSDTIQKFSLSSDGWGIDGSPSQDFQVNIANALTTSIGTIEPSVSLSKVEVKISESAGWAFYDAHLTYASEYVAITDDGDGCYVFDTFMKQIFGFGKNEIQSSSAQFAINRLLENSALATDVINIRITLSNGVTGEASFGLTIEDSALLQPANVALSPSSLVF